MPYNGLNFYMIYENQLSIQTTGGAKVCMKNIVHTHRMPIFPSQNSICMICFMKLREELQNNLQTQYPRAENRNRFFLGKKKQIIEMG